MSGPLFSVVIPTFNRSEIVKYAIQSVLKQTYDDYEVVISDNCSEDDTPQIVKQFDDPRVRYLRTPRHLVLADSWEYGRSQAAGQFVMIHGDDDAMVSTALAQFAEEIELKGADFLFSSVAEYHDMSFPGPKRNTLMCSPFSGQIRVLSAEEFIGPLFAFRQFRVDPSAFVFRRALAGSIVDRCGRFFATNGAEYFAWPLAAVFANRIVHIDLPLVITGRTGKSWGSTLVLGNPGKKKIEQYVADMISDRDWVPLRNFTFINLWAEGILMAQRLFPKELGSYQFDMREYLRRMAWELNHRQSLGVDVSNEVRELRAYLQVYPELETQLFPPTKGGNMPSRRERRSMGGLLIGKFRRRTREWFREQILRYDQIKRVREGQVHDGFDIRGADFGFYDILECAGVLRSVAVPPRVAMPPSPESTRRVTSEQEVKAPSMPMRIATDDVQSIGTGTIRAESGREMARDTGRDASPVRLIAFYLPQFHPIPENDEWWGKGFTEWKHVMKARPLFPGHYQPHLPADLGFYDLRLPEVRQAQADMASEYGIYGFCYYHYWFNGRRVLNRPFDEVLASGRPDFPFCICWANEDWTRAWDGRSGEILLKQSHSHEDDVAHIRALIPAFRDERYIRINGRPLFLVYHTPLLPNPRETAELWREAAISAGVGDPYLARVESHKGGIDPKDIGFDAAVEFAPEWRILGTGQFHRRRYAPLTKAGILSRVYADNRIYDYGALADRTLRKPEPSYPFFRGVTPSWDNSPRKAKDAVIFHASTPDKYEAWLSAVIGKTRERFEGDERLVFVNAWNEWGESNHLEPDQRWGLAYLEATRRAVAFHHAGSAARIGRTDQQEGVLGAVEPGRG